MPDQYYIMPVAYSSWGQVIEQNARHAAKTAQMWNRLPLFPTPQERQALGQRLRELRAQIRASGVPLLSWEEIDRELAERRGERMVDED